MYCKPDVIPFIANFYCLAFSIACLIIMIVIKRSSKMEEAEKYALIDFLVVGLIFLSSLCEVYKFFYY